MRRFDVRSVRLFGDAVAHDGHGLLESVTRKRQHAFELVIQKALDLRAARPTEQACLRQGTPDEGAVSADEAEQVHGTLQGWS